MKKFRTIIVEDEEYELDLLKKMLKEYPQIEIVESAEDIESSIAAIIFHKPDLIFFDVGLYGREAFVVLDLIKKYELNPCVIFTTGNAQYLKEAFNYSAFEFLLKPIDLEKLDSAILRLKQAESNNFADNYQRFNEAKNNLLINTTDGFIVIKPEEIVCMVADSGYTNIFLDSTKFEMVTKRIGELEEQLSSECFFRTHRSYLINLSKLLKVTRNKCILRFGQQTKDVEITRENKNKLKEILNGVSKNYLI